MVEKYKGGRQKLSHWSEKLISETDEPYVWFQKEAVYLIQFAGGLDPLPANLSYDSLKSSTLSVSQ